MKNYKIIVQYDGTRYKGWQVQKSTDATIQGKLQMVLSKLAGHPVEGLVPEEPMPEYMPMDRWQIFISKSIFQKNSSWKHSGIFYPKILL